MNTNYFLKFCFQFPLLLPVIASNNGQHSCHEEISSMNLRSVSDKDEKENECVRNEHSLA
ncbi:hypothetical protein J2S09_001714 [Bacillus fengqiuensis]|nr:hypothetical protein [Bacillus fengqiuensis]